MALCTRCGGLYSDDDAYLHKCRSQDLPQPGEMILPGGTRVPVTGQ